MKTKLKTALIYLFTITACQPVYSARGESEGGPSPEAIEGVETDPRTFSEIFESNLRDSETNVANARTPLDVEFAYSSGGVSESALINNYYNLDLAKQPWRLSSFKVYAGYEAWRRGGFTVGPTAGLGYGFREDVLEIDGLGRGTYTDAVRLKWAPIFAGIKIGYRFPRWKTGMLFARAGARYEWFSVAGSLDGLSQSYWSFGYNLSVGLNILESDPQRLDSWFGGIFVAWALSGPFSKEYRGVKASAYEIGLRFLL